MVSKGQVSMGWHGMAWEKAKGKRGQVSLFAMSLWLSVPNFPQFYHFFPFFLFPFTLFSFFPFFFPPHDFPMVDRGRLAVQFVSVKMSTLGVAAGKTQENLDWFNFTPYLLIPYTHAYAQIYPLFRDNKISGISGIALSYLGTASCKITEFCALAGPRSFPYQNLIWKLLKYISIIVVHLASAILKYNLLYLLYSLL